MSFKEKPQKSYPEKSFFGEKKQILLKCIKIHVIYEKKFYLKWILEDTHKNTLVIFAVNLMIWVLI